LGSIIFRSLNIDWSHAMLLSLLSNSTISTLSKLFQHCIQSAADMQCRYDFVGVNDIGFDENFSSEN